MHQSFNFQMRNHFHIAAFLTIKLWFFLCSNSQGGTPPASSNLLCISDCETCPVICSSPPATPKVPPSPPPPPPVHHNHPPPQPYYFELPPPTPPPAPPRPPPPSYISWVGAIPPPSVYVYNPGGQMGQRNVSLPYYYFYASKASPISHPLGQGFILFTFFVGFYVC